MSNSNKKKVKEKKDVVLSLSKEDWKHLQDIALAHIDSWCGNLNNKLWHMEDVEMSCEEIIAGYKLYIRAKEALSE